ncbi:MAG: 3-phosphoshikimate 1-carboxyvinyltransferase [Paludibacter sp.]|nr:3-phosphoshikimate 1-carboxyvinyltransferase [Paludibacter sp.]MDD4198359.1 3-phosphoshikimate 1-carboxyvinyltransferase [Paludibacter sp.]MDD4428334.1 3-phosphoshikimate 1-carboxyvinyltransferase [Paludibacter sp.]
MTYKPLFLNKKLINADITLPASKSISNRALILNALAYSPYEIENLADCDDTNVMLKALDSNKTTFDIGAAGTAMRFLTAFLSKTVGEWVITGSKRMKERPIKLLVDALNSLGGRIKYIENEGYPPLRIYGSALTGGEIHLNGGVSSQYISALMMIAPYMQKGLKIILEGNVISVPYILMTLNMMRDFGVKVRFENNVIEIKPQTYQAVRYKVESDWSAASYWYEILSIAGEGRIFLEGLQKDSYQGDSKVAGLFQQLGVKTEYLSNGIVLTPNNNTCDVFEYDFINQPDLAQTFAVTCCLKNIPFHFNGIQSLKIKETDRVEALIKELKKFGFVLTEPENGELSWDGKTLPLEDVATPSISTYDDHRMAMAFAPVALVQPVIIENPEVVSKSYPRFWEDIERIK